MIVVSGHGFRGRYRAPAEERHGCLGLRSSLELCLCMLHDVISSLEFRRGFASASVLSQACLVAVGCKLLAVMCFGF